ncbi:MAG TPA: YfhO family protein [Candidatus Saccharimonadaceae bacterium]|nr:YfhO family protein [Candidatus Saccharimonadaceae bacterium]
MARPPRPDSTTRAASGVNRPRDHRGPDVTSPAHAPSPAAGGRFVVAAIVLLAAWAMLWAPQLFQARVFARGDWPMDAPYARFSADVWRAEHERALWNPYVFLGVPAAASLADPRPQYLPDAALDALSRLDAFPVWPPLVLPLLAHLAGMLAAAALVRALWRAGTPAMIWAGVAWGALPNLVVPFAYGHHAQLVTASLMPLSLLAVHGVMSAATSRAVLQRSVGLALVVALQVLAGHPQFVYFSALLSGAFGLERAWRFRRPRRLVVGLGAALLGLAMATVVWWPMALYGGDSIRGLASGVFLEEVRRYSLALRDFLVFVWPRAMGAHDPTYWGGLNGTDFPQYFGGLAVALALGLVTTGRAWRDGAARFLAGAAVVAALLALGTRLGPAYAVLHDVLPLWSRFRVAVAVIVVAQLAVALLSARALDLLLAKGDVRARAWAIAGGAALALAGVCAVSGGAFDAAYAGAATHARAGFPAASAAAAAAPARGDLALQLALAGAALLALAARSAGGAARHAVAPLLLVLGAFDLGRVTLPILRGATAERGALAAPAPPALAVVARGDSLHRASAMSLDELTRDNGWIDWRARFAGGAHGTPPLAWAQLAGSGLLQRAGVERALAIAWVHAAPGDSVTDADRPAADGAAGVWHVRGALPRAYAVSRVEAPGNDLAVLSAMVRPDWSPAAVAFAADPRAAREYPGAPSAALAWIVDRPDHQVFECDAPAAVFVVVADAWFAGWTARVDGAPAPLERVDHVARGVALEAGHHRITLDYVPPGWALGRAISGWAALAWVLLAVAAAWPRGVANDD